MCLLPSMTVFCGSVTSYFPGMLSRYFLDDVGMVPVTLLLLVSLVFAFNIRRLSVLRPSYLTILLTSFLITFLSPEFTLSLNRHVPGSLWSTVMSGELWGRFCPFALFDSVIRLPYFCFLFLLPLLCSYQHSLSNFKPMSLHALKCSWANTLAYRFVYCSFAITGLADIISSTVSSYGWHCLHYYYYYYYYYYHHHSCYHLHAGIYNYTPETNHVSRVYSVAGLLYLQFVLHVILFRPWNKFCTIYISIFYYYYYY